MAQEHDSMVSTPIETLLDETGSKFMLVTLAAQRARQINSYYGQLGDGIGRMIPPQIASRASKPLSIAFEEIAEGVIVGVEPREPEAVVYTDNSDLIVPEVDPTMIVADFSAIFADDDDAS